MLVELHCLMWGPGEVRAGTSSVEDGAQDMSLSVDSLQALMARMRTEVEAPYAAISAQSAQLANLHATADLLRHVLHRLKLVVRLKVSTAAHNPSSCAASTVAWPGNRHCMRDASCCGAITCCRM